MMKRHKSVVMLSFIVAFCSRGGWGEELPDETLQYLKKATAFVKIKLGRLEGSGSGFLIHRQGHVGYFVTNHHVVEPPDLHFLLGLDEESDTGVKAENEPKLEIKVVLDSGTGNEQVFDAEVVAEVPDDDLAILKVNCKKLPEPIRFGAEIRLRETTPVIVLGFPFGERLSFSGRNPAITVTQAAVSAIPYVELSAKHLEPVAEGKVGQAVRFGKLVDKRFLETEWTQFDWAQEGTVAAWVHIGPVRHRCLVYSEFSSFPTFTFYVDHERKLTLASWHPKHDWTGASTPKGAVPEGQWTFVAFSVWDLTSDGGHARLTVNDQSWEFPFRVCGNDKSKTSRIVLREGNMLDEFYTSIRALSKEEVEAIRQLGLQGRGFGRDQ